MRGKIRLVLMALILMSCSKDGMQSETGVDYNYGRQLSHEKIVLGSRLENPYKTANITKALHELYPTRADRVEVKTTDLYVRFLPKNDSEYRLLEELGLNLMDHPLDYEILEEGDWYHDPEVPENNVTWQYAVVSRDFVFPDVEYEIIDECYLAENDASTKSDEGIDWDAVERHSYILTGNEDKLAPETKASRVKPSGRITIVDEHINGGAPFGVAGVMVSCNSFIRFAQSYTDEEGYYKMNKAFSSKPRYRLVFKNKKGFALGFNLILVPASISTLGKASPNGINMTVTKKSESKLYKRCVVNNAAYDYYMRCAPADMNLALPPKDMRIWLFHKLKASSAVMMHHGAIIDHDLVRSFLGDFGPLIKCFLPDITLGVSGKNDYRSIYSAVCHELAHSSHFSKVGASYWNRYILYIITSFIASGGMTYGDGTGEGAGICEVGEMWAYHVENRMYHDRYGGNFPTFGTSYWFHPQIFRYVEEKGMELWEIFSVLNANVKSVTDLENALITARPDQAAAIKLIFDRYI